MHQKLVHLLTTIDKIFLPLLFITNQASITLFTHVHIINGVVIVHSHPYKKSAHHHHTKGQIQIIFTWNRSNTLANAYQVPSFASKVSIINILYFMPAPLLHIIETKGLSLLRAPPLSIL